MRKDNPRKITMRAYSSGLKTSRFSPTPYSITIVERGMVLYSLTDATATMGFGTYAAIGRRCGVRYLFLRCTADTHCSYARLKRSVK